MSDEIALEFFRKVPTYYGRTMDCSAWMAFTHEAKLNMVRSYSSGLPFGGITAHILSWQSLSPTQIVARIDAYCLEQTMRPNVIPLRIDPPRIAEFLQMAQLSTGAWLSLTTQQKRAAIARIRAAYSPERIIAAVDAYCRSNPAPSRLRPAGDASDPQQSSTPWGLIGLFVVGFAVLEGARHAFGDGRLPRHNPTSLTSRNRRRGVLGHGADEEIGGSLYSINLPTTPTKHGDRFVPMVSFWKDDDYLGTIEIRNGHLVPGSSLAPRVSDYQFAIAEHLFAKMRHSRHTLREARRR